MEKFRELEKEYKQRKLTKVVFQNHNEIESKFISDSGEESDGEPREYNMVKRMKVLAPMKMQIKQTLTKL